MIVKNDKNVIFDKSQKKLKLFDDSQGRQKWYFKTSPVRR